MLAGGSPQFNLAVLGKGPRSGVLGTLTVLTLSTGPINYNNNICSHIGLFRFYKNSSMLELFSLFPLLLLGCKGFIYYMPLVYHLVWLSSLVFGVAQSHKRFTK